MQMNDSYGWVEILFQVVHSVAGFAFDSYFAVVLGGKHEVGHGHLAVGVDSFHAALVDKHAQLVELSVGWGGGYGGGGGGGFFIAPPPFIHRKGFLFLVIVDSDM